MVKLSLSKLEQQVLFKKYVKSGLSYENAHIRLEKVKNHLRGLVMALKQQNKSKDEINERFQQEFEKIWLKAEI